MRNIFLLPVATVLLVAFAIAQTPAPVAMTLTAASIKGCLGGSDGAYTLAQDGTKSTLKITASSVDLKPHIGHQVELTGQKSSAAVFGAPETVSVTGVSMLSEHCPMTAASTPTVADPATASLAAPVAPTPATTPAPAADAAAVKPAETATTTTTTTVSTPPVAPAATAPAPEVVAAAKPAETAAAPVVLASATAPLPNTAPPSLKPVKVTGKLGSDGKTFVNDKDSKSWTVNNPDAVKGHEGHHVTLTAHLDAVKNEVEVVSLKMAK